MSDDGHDPTVAAEWRCPHPRLDGHDDCIFHAAPAVRTEYDVGAVLVHAVDRAAALDTREQRRRHRQFLDATLPDATLDLNDAVVAGGSNHAVDLRGSDVGTLRLRNARVETPLDLRGASVTTLVATNAECHRVYAQGLSIGDAVIFEQATVERLYLSDADAVDEGPSTVNFYQAEVAYADFPRAELDRGNFLYADFGEAGFIDAEFGLLTFFGADFESAYLDGLDADYLNFEYATARNVHADGKLTVASFRGTRADKLDLDGVDTDRLRLDKLRVGTLGLANADIGVARMRTAVVDRATLENVSVAHALQMTGSRLDHLSLSPTSFVPPDSPFDVGGYVDLREATVGAGVVEQPEDDEILIDLADATVGDLDLRGHSDAYLHDLRVLRTTSDGFDFEQLTDGRQTLGLHEHGYEIHRTRDGAASEIAVLRELQDAVETVHEALEDRAVDALGARATGNDVDFGHPGLDDPDDTLVRAFERLHDTSEHSAPRDGLESETVDDPSVDDLVKTYLEAETGAAKTGEAVAAGRFFELKRSYRRHRYRQRGRWWPFVRSYTLAGTAGYGERPEYVFLVAGGVVVSFTAAYLIAFQTPVSALTLGDAGDRLVFSLQSFTTLLVGGPPGAPNRLVQFLSAVEGFAGAFLVALLVFALTRQVHR